MAVTGPFYDDIVIEGLRSRKVWHRQTPPFKLPLNYRRSLYRGYYSDSVTGQVRSPATLLGLPTIQRIDGAVEAYDTNSVSYQRAYDSLVSRMKREDGGASMGVTVAEARSSWTMINDRFNRLVRLADLIRHKPNGFVEAAGLLLLNERNASRLRKAWPSRKAVARDFASSYLELIFGWGPLLKDIQDAINVLQNPPSTSKEVGVGFEQWDNRGSSRPAWLPPSGWLLLRDYGKTSRRLCCNVKITNPNLDLANRLGFVNLPSIAYELIPGSFLFDWFVPIGRFLDSFTDFVGREVSGTYMSIKTASSYIQDSNYAGAAGRGFELSEDSGTLFVRWSMTSLPTPKWFRGFRLPTRDLQGRAITLFALFTQSFAK